jgi:hypothetical protein
MYIVEAAAAWTLFARASQRLGEGGSCNWLLHVRCTAEASHCCYEAKNPLRQLN